MKLSSKNLKVLIIFGVILTATNLRAPLTDVPPILDFIIAQFNLNPTQAGLIITIPLILFSGGLIGVFAVEAYYANNPNHAVAPIEHCIQENKEKYF